MLSYCTSIFYKIGNLDSLPQEIEPQAHVLCQEMLKKVNTIPPLLSKVSQEGHLTKFLLKFSDGLESESVAIPMESGSTLCISSQVGCKMGCAFCETGRMGLIRHLSTKEIISQVFFAIHHLQIPVRNIVFMGMGEPLDNYDNVLQAVRVLTDPSGIGLGASRITISTSGLVDKMYQFMEDFPPAVNLAVSVNAPNDEVRKKIMPVNRKWNMAQLKEMMQSYCAHPRRQILAEYVLIEDVNDSLEQALELAEYLRGLKVKINIIPYNPQSKDRFAPPSQEKIENFIALLRNQGYQVLIRKTKGQDIMAACGQLGNLQLRKELAQAGKLAVF